MSEINEAAARKVVVYGRVADECKGALDAQVARLRRLASLRGCAEVSVVAEVRPHGVSEEALRVLCAADIVFVRDASRLTRRLADHDVWASLRAAGVEVVTADGASPLGQDLARLDTLALVGDLMEIARAHQLERMRLGRAAAKSRRESQR